MERQLMVTVCILVLWCGSCFVHSLPKQSTDCSTRRFHHPIYGWKYCSDYCHANRTSKGQLEFCSNVCPNYHIDCGIDIKIPSTLTVTSAIIKSSDLLESFRPTTASPHISRVSSVEAATSKVKQVTEFEYRSTKSIEGDYLSHNTPGQVTSYVIPIVTGIAIPFLLVATFAVAVFCWRKNRTEQRRRRRGDIYHVGRTMKWGAPSRKKIGRPTEETRQFNQNEYDRELRAAMPAQPGFSQNQS